MPISASVIDRLISRSPPSTIFPPNPHRLVLTDPLGHSHHPLLISVKNNRVVPHVLVQHHPCRYLVPASNLDSRYGCAVDPEKILVPYFRMP